MGWTNTLVTQYVVADRRCHVYDCVHGDTYGGGQAVTGATGSDGPTLADLGFADVTDPEMYIRAYEVPGGTGGYIGRNVYYDLDRELLIVGVTAAADISGSAYRIEATGKYGL